MIQVIYGRENETMRIRKAAGEGDISGDYTNYNQVKTVNGMTIKGRGQQLFSVRLGERRLCLFCQRCGTAVSGQSIGAGGLCPVTARLAKLV